MGGRSEECGRSAFFTLTDEPVTTPSPVVQFVTPSVRSTSGGTSVTIFGQYFQNGAVVSFGGTPATGVSVQSGNALTCTSPAHFAGSVAVTVANPDAQSGSLAGAFLYGP